MAWETGRSTSADSALVETRADFEDFLDAVLEDFRGTGEVEWENATLERFLDGLAAVASARIVDQPGQELATWRLFAELVAMATGYE